MVRAAQPCFMHRRALRAQPQARDGPAAMGHPHVQVVHVQYRYSRGRAEIEGT